jgi:hypothetical protein
LLPADWMRVGCEMRVGMDSSRFLVLPYFSFGDGDYFNPQVMSLTRRGA